MKFSKITLKNIRSYKNQEIIFPEGSMLLSGDIGSGKTTILLAIEYALFGLQPGQKGSALLRNNSPYGSVALEFELDGKEIIIERKLKRSSKNVSNEYAAITIDGEKIESSITEIKTKIISILGYPQEFIKKNNLLYRYTVYTPQESMKQIITEDTETRLNILRHIFGIDKYKRIRENLVIILNFLKENSKVLQSEIKGIEQENLRIGELNLSIALLENKISVEKIKFHILQEKKSGLEIEYISIEEKIKEKNYLQSEVEKTFLLISAKKESLSYINLEMKEIDSGLSELNKNINLSVYQDLEQKQKIINSDINYLNLSLISLMGEISSLRKLIEDNLAKKERIFKIDICPTCLQDVPDFHKHNILNETEKVLAETSQHLSLMAEEKKLKESAIEKKSAELNEIKNSLTELEILKSKISFMEKSRAKLLQLEKNREKTEKDILLLEEHIVGLKEKLFNMSKFESLYKAKSEEIKFVLNEEKKSEIAIAELKKEIEMTKKEIYHLKSLVSEKEIKKKQLSNNIELSDWLSNKFSLLIDFIERNVLIKLRREFSSLFSKWFSMLVPSETFQVFLDESFTPVIAHNDIEMDYAFLSGGERTAIALAYRLALNQTINSVLSKIKTRDIVILDEPTDGFSDSQLDKIRDVLEELDIKQLIIVSHEQKIEGFVENVIRLKKSFNESKIDEEILSSIQEQTIPVQEATIDNLPQV